MNELRQLILTLPDETVLALNAYFESRGEYRRMGTDLPLIATMAVVMNRVYCPRYPDPIPQIVASPIEEVVAQKSQFSWTLSNDPQYTMALSLAQNPDAAWGRAWEACKLAAQSVVDGQAMNPVENATYYFNPQVVSPTWAFSLVQIRLIGNHLFMADPSDPDILWDAPRES